MALEQIIACTQSEFDINYLSSSWPKTLVQKRLRKNQRNVKSYVNNLLSCWHSVWPTLASFFREKYSHFPELRWLKIKFQVSKHFMPVTLSVVSERFRRIMMMHPEVEALTAGEQAK